MSTIALHSTLTISQTQTVKNRLRSPKNHQ